MVVIDCIVKAIDWSASYIKAVRGVIEVLVVIRRIFGGTHPFNKELGADECNNATSIAPP